jgi:hypothetical protein
MKARGDSAESPLVGGGQSVEREHAAAALEPLHAPPVGRSSDDQPLPGHGLAALHGASYSARP